MDAFRLSLREDFVVTTLKNLDISKPERFQDLAIEFYTPVITVLVIASVLLLFRWELLPRIINSCGDSLLKYEKLLVSLFAVLGTSMLIGLTIFIRGNQLVRHGSNKLIHSVPARVFGHFIQVTEVENFCPLNKTEIAAVAENYPQH